MNRKERRAKLSRNATRAEILPGTHGPIQSMLVDTMKDVVNMLRHHVGKNFDITLFVAERVPADGSDRLPRFNYISTADRRDMIAVLDAFAARQKEQAATLDKIEDAPPTETKQ